jgi:GNAT superfamily N-acetyltransferase
LTVDEISLRTCTLDDTDILALIGAATFLESFAGILEGESILAHCARGHAAATYRELIAKPRTTAWLAEVKGAPIGYAILTAPDLPLNDLTDQDLELKRIYLLSRFQGTGTGQRLMEIAISEARNRNARRLLLGVYKQNRKALAFYARPHPVAARTVLSRAKLHNPRKTAFFKGRASVVP